MLQLDEEAFDQGEQGWRLLMAGGCHREAAEIIRDYRQSHTLRFETTSWMHEAQMRAFAGDYAEATRIMPFAKHKVDGTGWNKYLDATIAFLKRDRLELLDARKKLAFTPLPHTYNWLFDDAGNAVSVPAPPADEPWPPNLKVVDALIRCFDRSYQEAYLNPECHVR